LRALAAVVRVADTDAAADDAATLEGAVVALVAHVHQRRRSHVAVANDALAVAALAHVADGDARLLAAQDEVDVCGCGVSSGGGSSGSGSGGDAGRRIDVNGGGGVGGARTHGGEPPFVAAVCAER